MKRCIGIAVAIVLAWQGTTLTLAQTPPTEADAPKEVKEPKEAKQAPSDKVAATVNGHKVMQAEVDALFEVILARQMQGRPMPPDQMAAARERVTPRLLEQLIDDYLLDADVTSAQVTVTDKYLSDLVETMLRGHLLRSGLTREELSEQLKTTRGKALDDLLGEQLADPEFKKSMLQMKLLAKKYPEESKITDEEIKASYEQSLKTVYSRPATIRASHILIKTEGMTTDEQKAEARKKAETVLIETKKPDADFAALAKQHSEGPSGPRGGDLGFFPREGSMVEPFAAAAFALTVGGVSEIVETPFGHHIIKVTGKKEANVITLEQATESIREELKARKMQGLRTKHIAKLKETAKIEMPE